MFRPTFRTVIAIAVAASLLVACGGSSGGSSSSGQKAKLTASYSELVPDELWPWGAAEGGYFSRNGLDVSLTSVSSTNGVAALLSGQVQLAQLGGSEVLSAAAGGADVQIIANLCPYYPYLFMASSSVTSMNDLKGKKVGISSFGGSSDTATRAGLRKDGLNPDSDVTIVPTGSSSNRIAALRSGSIQAGMSQPPESVTLQKDGFRPLLDLAKLKLPAANTVLAVRKSWAGSHHSEVQAYVDSLVQAVARERKDKEFTWNALARWQKLKDRSALDPTYAFYMNEVFPTYPYPRAAQFADAVQVGQKKNSKLAGFNVAGALDDSYVKNAANRKLG
jgi:NitT/TauT family transport system substrate-binding protein